MSTAAVDSSSATAHHAARRAARAPLLLTAAFAAVYLVWGSTYFAIRIGLESFPPLLLAGSRHLLAGVVLYPILRWKTGIRPTAAQWRAAAITGCLLLFLSNGGVCWAEQTVPSGITALLAATVSLWLVLVEWLRPGGSRPGPRVVLGLLMGFTGLALLVGPAHLGGSERVHLGGAAILVLASFSWACGSLYSKHSAHLASPFLGVAMQSLAGGAVLWTTGLLLGEGRTLAHAGVSLRSGVALGYLTVFGSGIGFTAYLYLLKRTTASRVGTYAFVNPVVALLLGWAFAGEAVTLRTWLAAAVILTAVILVISAPHPAPGHEADAIPTPGEA